MALFTNICLTSFSLADRLACSKDAGSFQAEFENTCAAKLNLENQASSGSGHASIQKSEFYANSFTTYSESVT